LGPFLFIYGEEHRLIS